MSSFFMLYFPYMEPNGQEIEDLSDAPNLRDLMQKPGAVAPKKKSSAAMLVMVLILVIIIAAGIFFLMGSYLK